MSRNPYAAPQSSLTDRAPSACVRDGNILVVPAGHDLPPRCVKCNEAAELDRPRKFAWHHPGWYLFIPINILVYAVIATLVQIKATLAIGLCQAHRARRRNAYFAALAIMMLGTASLWLCMTDDGAGLSVSMLASLGGVALIVAVVVAIVGGRVVWPSRITREEARMKGCGSAFLDSLPNA